jgi:hypothetical protein
MQHFNFIGMAVGIIKVYGFKKIAVDNVTLSAAKGLYDNFRDSSLRSE